jgi:hypothetical protein
VTECQGCGAWNDASRTVCVLCGTPLAEIDEWDAAADPPPLPPLPDGGLASAMPSWLREPPVAAAMAPMPAPSAVVGDAPALVAAPALPPLGPQADPRTFLNDDDFPLWLRELAARQAARPAPPPDGIAPSPLPHSDDAIWPNWPEGLAPPSAPRTAPALATPSRTATLAETPSTPAPAVRAGDERRARDPWETALLVLLFLGVIVATAWALMSNGVFGPGW